MRFIIPPGELEYAERISAQFKLYLVSEIDSAILKYQELPLRFLGRRPFTFYRCFRKNRSEILAVR